MQSALVDSGPLIALFDRDDDYHRTVADFLKEWKGVLWTTWPVLTEVSHMLDFSLRAQMDCLSWVYAGGVRVWNLEEADVASLLTLMQKYGDRPMDLADASLIVLAERAGIRDILTLDRDFAIYRISGRKSFHTLLNLHA